VSITQLDYEQTLAALQAFIGTRVVVSLQDATTEFMGATFMGPLNSAPSADLALIAPDLLGDFAGESLFFVVVDPAQPAVTASFAIWREGFEWGRRVEQPQAVSVSYQVAGMQIRVRPAPQIPGLPT
jgi:hypothetical protein